MNFRWLKQLMPRGLYGRAALILIVPVITIQLVVSIVFIQRHFERVTVQMTSAMMRELQLVQGLVDAAPDIATAHAGVAALQAPLEMEIVLPADLPPAADAAEAAADDGVGQGQFLRDWSDLTGIVVLSTLQGGMSDLMAVDLRGRVMVRLWLPTHHGVLEIAFRRGLASAANPHQLLVLMIGVSVLMTIIAYLYLRNQLRPIRRMAAAAEAFGRGQTVPLRISGATEVRRAGAAFLDMRARITRHLEQRTLMLSGVSHDLRTPLTRLKLGLSMLPRDGDTEDEIAAMERDVTEMSKLVEAFLDFARDGAVSGAPERRDPCAFVAEVVADAHRVGFPVDMRSCPAPDQTEIAFRPAALRRALENLIGNAVRYGTRAEVSVIMREAAVEIRVEDNGPGIAPEDREEALKPFARLDPARNQNKGQGVGLGLSIAADIMRAHGGSLRLEQSTRLGGLSARLVLPR